MSFKGEDILLECYEQYKQLVELSPVAICVQSNDEIVFINTAGVKLFGVSDPSELIGRNVTDFFAPYNQHLLDKLPKFETKLYRGNGTIIDVEVSTTPITFQDKQAIQIVFNEITKRKQTEEIILQSRHDWEEIFNGITDMITIHDTDFNIIHANKAAKELLKLPFLGLNRRIKCYRYYHGKDSPPEGCPSCKCLKTGKPANFEIFEPHLNMYIEIRAMPRFNSRNQLIGLIHIARDVTRRKQAEAELQRAKDELEAMVERRTSELSITNKQLIKKIAEHRKAEEALRRSENKYRNLSKEFHVLLDGIPDGLILLSSDLKIKWVNKAALNKFGKRNVTELKEQYCYKVCCGISSPCEGCPVIRSFKTGKEENSQFTSPKGRILDIRAFPIIDDSGNINNVIELSRDITEETNLQAENMRTRQLASLGELAAGIAHEINNPINNIINYAQILLDERQSEDKDYEIGQRIMRDADRIATIVRSLLSFARIRKEEKTFMHLNEIFADTLPLIKAQLEKDGIILKLDVPSNLPKIFIHPQQIQQVFLNVISNSRYALNKKYPTVHKNKILSISCKKISLNGTPYVRILFHDRGTGIPANILDKVMNPFFSTKPSNIGTGLGLSISHGIISEHGGKFTIDSVEGEYTNVNIDLPVKIPERMRDEG
jgi:PAS domain S-box-containing protein